MPSTMPRMGRECCKKVRREGPERGRGECGVRLVVKKGAREKE